MTAAYQLTSTDVVIRTADGAAIPNDTRNRDRRLYLQFLTDGGTPDPVPTPELATKKAESTAIVNATAARLRLAKLPAGGVATDTWLALRYQEAIAADADGSPTSLEYPLLNAEIPETGATIAAVADAVIVELGVLKAALAAIETVRATAAKAIQDSVDVAAVQAVLDALSWPA